MLVNKDLIKVSNELINFAKTVDRWIQETTDGYISVSHWGMFKI